MPNLAKLLIPPVSAKSSIYHSFLRNSTLNVASSFSIRLPIALSEEACINIINNAFAGCNPGDVRISLLSHGFGIMKLLTKVRPISKSRSDGWYGVPLDWGKLISDENSSHAELSSFLTCRG